MGEKNKIHVVLKGLEEILYIMFELVNILNVRISHKKIFSLCFDFFNYSYFPVLKFYLICRITNKVLDL